MKNEYEINGDAVTIVIKSAKYGRIETKISKNKLKKAMELNGAWYAHFNKLSGTFYVRGNLTNDKNGKKTTSLHRWINDVGAVMFIDHINHDTLDNTDENLRIATPSENSQNRKMQKNNSSGVRGVYWESFNGRWRAYFRKNGKRTHVGYFKNLEDAEKAVKEARKKHMPFSQEAIV